MNQNNTSITINPANSTEVESTDRTSSVTCGRRRRRSRTGGSLGSRALIAAGICLGVTAIGSATAPSPVDAWSHYVSAQRPGAVVVPQVQAVDLSTVISYSPYITTPVLNLLSTTGPTVYRSPATRGAQNVVGLYIAQEWNGSRWVDIGSQRTPARQIRAGASSVRLPAMAFAVQRPRGYYRTVWSFAWTDASTGRGIGSTVIVPSRTADHRCVTYARPCASNANYFRIGRMYQLGGGW